MQMPKRELPNIDLTTIIDDVSPISDVKESRELKKAKKKNHWADIYSMVNENIQSQPVRDMIFTFLEGRIKKGLTNSQWQLMLDDVNTCIKQKGESETVILIKNSIIKNYMAPIYLNESKSGENNKVEGFSVQQNTNEKLSNKEY